MTPRLPAPRRLCPQLVILWLMGMSSVLAQKAPELGYVFPPAIAVGETKQVILGGYDFTPDMEFFVHGDNTSLQIEGPPGDFLIPEPPYWFGEKGSSPAFPIPREIPARIKVDSTGLTGLKRWQVANANGSAATAVFLVSDIREITEKRFRDEPMEVGSLPVGVSARLSRIAEVDRYLIRAERDGPVSVEMFARRLGTDFNGVLQVHDMRGRMVADVADTQGRDVALTFDAQAGMEYTLRLHDADFRGNRAFVYRLAITAGPRVVATVPARLTRGKTQQVRFIGHGVATGAARLESVVRSVVAPADSSSSTLSMRLEADFGESPGFEIPLSNMVEDTGLPESNETPRAESPRRLSTPGAITDWMPEEAKRRFRFAAKKDENWTVSAESQAIGSELDVAIAIFNSDGKQLVENDDFPGGSDSRAQFVVPADGDYDVVVSDLSGQDKNLAAIFRLVLEKRAADFSLTIPQQLNVPIGGTAQLAVAVERMGGFADEIAIELEGMPDGMTTKTELMIPAGKDQLKITVECADTAAAGTARFRVVGKASINGHQVVKKSSSPAAGNLAPRDAVSQRVADAMCTSIMKPRFNVQLIDKNRQRAVHRGTTYPAPFLVKRDEDFDGPVHLHMAARQGRHRQGISAPVITVPSGNSEVLYPCFMPEWLETNRTTRMVVLGVAEQKDPQGRSRFVTAPADARITMILEGALLKISHEAPELTIGAGEAFQVPVTVSRSAKLQTPVKIKIVPPEQIQDLLSMEPAEVTLPVGVEKMSLKIDTQNAERLQGRWPIVIRASTLQDNHWRVMSQTEVVVDFTR